MTKNRGSDKHGNSGADDRKAEKLQQEIDARNKAIKDLETKQSQRDN